MECRLNIIVVENGVLHRHEIRLPNLTEEQFENHVEVSKRFSYGSDDLTDGTDKCKVFYTFSLDPKERQSFLDRKKQTP